MLGAAGKDMNVDVKEHKKNKEKKEKAKGGGFLGLFGGKEQVKGSVSAYV